MEVVASISQGRTAAEQCGLFTYKSFPVIFEPPCTTHHSPGINRKVLGTRPILRPCPKQCGFRVSSHRKLDQKDTAVSATGRYTSSQNP